MSRIAYIGSTIFATDKKYLLPYIGQNGDTAYIINPDRKEVVAEYAKYNKEWVPVNIGDGSGSSIDISEIEEAISQLQSDVSTISSNLNIFRTTTNENINSLNDKVDQLDIPELTNIPDKVDTLTTKLNSNIQMSAKTAEDLTELDEKVNTLGFIKGVEIDPDTKKLVFTKQDNNTIELDVETGSSGVITPDDISSMWDD